MRPELTTEQREERQCEQRLGAELHTSWSCLTGEASGWSPVWRNLWLAGWTQRGVLHSGGEGRGGRITWGDFLPNVLYLLCEIKDNDNDKIRAENEEEANEVRKNYSEREACLRTGCESRPALTSSPQGTDLTSPSPRLFFGRRIEHVLSCPAMTHLE